MQKTTIISLGGSLIFPEDIDVDFLMNFKRTVEKQTKKGRKFVIFCGGGKLARKMQQSASKVTKLTEEELDWLGIHATKLNAHLVRTIFKDDAENSVLENPTQKIKFRKKVMVASGWKPGCGTDYDAILVAKNIGAKEVINMSNVDFVYDKDPKINKDAKKIERIRWAEFRKLIGSKWKAGMNAPFDPVAAKGAQECGIKVSIVGKDLKNLENLLEGKKFKGTVIS